MKKNLLAILFLCITVSLISGCAEKHQTSGWDVDLTSHWQICEECGEIVRQGEHKLKYANGGSIGECTVCGATVIDWGDFTTVSLYDDSDANDGAGNLLKDMAYDSEGNITCLNTYEYEYDENGNIIASYWYQNEKLFKETHYIVIEEESVPEKEIQIADDGSVYTWLYTLNNEGENYVSSTTYEYSDGAKRVETYDEKGTIIRSISYDQEGYAYWDNIYEPTYDESGNLIGLVESYYDLSGKTYDADGNLVSRDTYEDTLLQYGNGYSYEYDDEGNKIIARTYYNGSLQREETYKYVTEESTYTDEDGNVYTNETSYSYTDSCTTYNYDGSKTITIYDDNHNVLSEVNYDANGNEIN